MSATPEVIEVPVSTLVPVPSAGIVRQVAPTGDIVAAQAAYHELCGALLDPNTDYQRIGRKDFPKKSAWRKLAVAFNVSVSLVERSYERDGAGRIIRAEVVARATAPNGRTMDGIGACDLFEKCCPGTDGAPEDCTNRSQYHTHCRANCSGRAHFSNPSHDLPSTAHTRATNRACADLFGMGEVSAEEITNAGAVADQHQEDPFVALGWANQAEHNLFRHEVDERIKAAPPEVKRTVKQWVDSTTPGYRTNWGRPLAEAYRDLVNGLLDQPPAGVDPETGEVAASGHQPAQQGHQQPAASSGGGGATSGGQEAPAPPARPDSQAGTQAPDQDGPEGEDPEERELSGIRFDVGTIHLSTVKKELRDGGLSDEGDPDSVRERLTLHRYNLAVQARVGAAS